MRTNPISNQHFNGNFIYITKDGKKHYGNLQKRLPHMYVQMRNELKSLLKEEPFDVFISRGESPLHFNIFASGGKTVNTEARAVQLIPNKYPTYNPVDYYTNPLDFENAVYGAIDDYKIGKFSK